MPSSILPKALKPGDTIAWIAPSARVNDIFVEVLWRATKVFTDRGYKVRTLYNQDADIQSSIANRISELRQGFSDPTISALVCVTGGANFTELLPYLLTDKELHETIRANPKIVMGYSDITGLHFFLHAVAGLRTFHGPGAIPDLGEPNNAADVDTPLGWGVREMFRALETTEPLGDIARSSFYAPDLSITFRSPPSTTPPRTVPNSGWKWLRPGRGQGRLFGGTLTLVARLQGIRPIVPDWHGRIIFLESATGDDMEQGTPIARIQTSVSDLIAGGVFDEAEGLVIGRPFGYDSDLARVEYTNVIQELICEGSFTKKKFPILFNVDFGHAVPGVTLPYDAMAVLDSEKDEFKVIESGVV